VVDPRFKLSPFDSADRRRRALKAMVWAMEMTTSSLNEGSSTLRTLMDSDVPKGRTSTSIHMRERTSMHVTAH